MPDLQKWIPAVDWWSGRFLYIEHGYTVSLTTDKKSLRYRLGRPLIADFGTRVEAEPPGGIGLG